MSAQDIARAITLNYIHAPMAIALILYGAAIIPIMKEDAIESGQRWFIAQRVHQYAG